MVWNLPRRRLDRGQNLFQAPQLQNVRRGACYADPAATPGKPSVGISTLLRVRPRGREGAILARSFRTES